MNRSPLIILAFLLTLTGCTLAKVQVNVAGKRSALENQVLGSYNSLTKQALLSASVRGVDPTGKVTTPPALSGEGADARDALQVLAFHADDVDSFKRLGWVGEDNRGLLTSFELDKTKAPDDLKDFAARVTRSEFEAIVKAVNKARNTVMLRVVQTGKDLKESDLPQVRLVFAKLNQENAVKGDRIQTAEGAWTVKQ